MVCYLLGMKFLFLRISVLKHLRRKSACSEFPMPLQWVVFFYVMLCTRTDIWFEVGMVSRYRSNLGPKYWTTAKHTLKYLRRTRDYVFRLQIVERV